MSVELDQLVVDCQHAIADTDPRAAVRDVLERVIQRGRAKLRPARGASDDDTFYRRTPNGLAVADSHNCEGGSVALMGAKTIHATQELP